MMNLNEIMLVPKLSIVKAGEVNKIIHIILYFDSQIIQIPSSEFNNNNCNVHVLPQHHLHDDNP